MMCGLEDGRRRIPCALGVEVKSATLSLTTTQPDNIADPEARRRAALITLSGPAAEQRLCSYSDEPCAEFWCSPVWGTNLLNVISHLGAAGGGMIAPVKREAEQLVRKHWAAIERVADALAETGELTGDEIDQLIVSHGSTSSIQPSGEAVLADDGRVLFQIIADVD
jgi:hypothetical protein